MFSDSATLKIQVNYQQRSICKGRESLIELLRHDGDEDPWRYIRFFSLRNHGQTPLTQTPVTEMIYIHSKLLIVDDTALVIGSANINDRSMLGSRDHEIAVVCRMNKDEECAEVILGGKQTHASKMVHDMRCELMMEHFGLIYDEVKDPLASREKLCRIASSNSALYFHIFKCEPDNSIRNFEQLAQVRAQREEL